MTAWDARLRELQTVDARLRRAGWQFLQYRTFGWTWWHEDHGVRCRQEALALQAAKL